MSVYSCGIESDEMGMCDEDKLIPLLPIVNNDDVERSDEYGYNDKDKDALSVLVIAIFQAQGHRDPTGGVATIDSDREGSQCANPESLQSNALQHQYRRSKLHTPLSTLFLSGQHTAMGTGFLPYGAGVWLCREKSMTVSSGSSDCYEGVSMHYLLMGVWQGCMLAPCLTLDNGEILSAFISASATIFADTWDKIHSARELLSGVTLSVPETERVGVRGTTIREAMTPFHKHINSLHLVRAEQRKTSIETSNIQSRDTHEYELTDRHQDSSPRATAWRL
ncbi:hypothetical protein Tco_1336016 [Tanacetum coccineum]